MYKVSDLNEESGFNDLMNYYDRHKHKEYHTWLSVEQVFPHPGKQGLAGIMRTKDNKLYVFKLSQYINYLVQHELTVMKELNSIGAFCPHFCKGVGGVLADVDPKSRRSGNPFEINTKYPIEKEVLLMEYLSNTTKLYNYIRSDRIDDKIIYSTVKQTLMAIALAQRESKFTHYDLHSNNIMMKKCSRNLVFLYILDDNNQYCVPTYGRYPVIIDFGFSYAKSMNDGPLWPSMGHTDVGFTSDRFDPIADPKLFLVTVSGEMDEKRPSKTSRKFTNMVKNLFYPLNIDWKSGWDLNGVSASDEVLNILQEYNGGSDLFNSYDHFCIDILQSLIVLPLQEQKYNNIGKSYKAFLKEFVKIEKEIGNPFYCMYILKGIVDTAREIRTDYINKSTRNDAVNHFQQSIYQIIDTISKFCRPKDVHYEKMLCGLLCLSKNIEGVLYKAMMPIAKQKRKEYKKLPIKSVEEMYAVMEVNLPDTYTFNDNTVVMVMDAVNKRCERMTLSSEEIERINETESVCRGSELYDIYTKNS